MKKIILVILILFSISTFTSCKCINQKANHTQESYCGWDEKTPLAVEFGYKMNDEDIEFYGKATRMLANSDEYFPSSETFRVMLQNEAGELIWNSGENGFLSVITPAFPEKVGETYNYGLEWNMKIKEKRIPKGKYTALLSLPMHPKPYTASFEIKVE